MSQALTSRIRNLLTFLTCILLAACNGSYTAFESDRDFNVDLKTADIELESSELKTLVALQSAFFGHYQSAAYEFLDASDLPVGLSQTNNPNEYFCESDNNGDTGRVVYTFTKAAGAVHNVGDQLSVTYTNCQIKGSVYTGKMSAKYSKLRGLNNRFVNMTTSECVENVQDERSIADSNIIYVTGDALVFSEVSDYIQVDVFSVAYIENDGNTEQVDTRVEQYYIDNNQKNIFVLQPFSLPDNAVTSVNGDKVYSLINSDNYEENCQGYERTLSVKFNDFSTNRIGFIETILNGTVSLVEAQGEPMRMNQSFEDSDFKTTVIQGQSTQAYSMKDYNVERSVDYRSRSYAYEFDGFISNNDVLGGLISVTNIAKLIGSLDSRFPSSGGFELKGKGFERVYVIPNNLQLDLQVDHNGDSTNNGAGDIDIIINTTWEDLFERNFKE